MLLARPQRGTGTGKARASPPAYVEPQSDARTTLAAVFNILSVGA